MQIDIKIMGVPVKYEVPANLSELVALPGSSEDLIYKLALKQILYHGSYGAIRAKVTELLEKAGNGSRRSYVGKKVCTKVETTDKEGNAVSEWQFENGKKLSDAQVDDISTETDADFFARVAAEAGVEKTSYTTTVQEAADVTPIDVTRKERTAAEKKATKTHIKIATEIHDNGALERVAAQLASDLDREIILTGDTANDINQLALAIGANEKREAELRKNKYMTMG